MRAVALLLAAGRGERLEGADAKAFVELSGRPLLAYAAGTVAFAPAVEGCVVAVPADREDEARRAVEGLADVLAVVPGGSTRQASVRSALRAAPPELEAVVCHDVARPFATPALYAAVLGALAEADGAVPVVGVRDTVKRVREGRVRETIEREGLALAQTPQAFRRAALEEAHRRALEDGMEGTDDAVLLERAGFRVAAVAGERTNLKITEPSDLELAEAMVRAGVVGETLPSGPGDRHRHG